MADRRKILVWLVPLGLAAIVLALFYYNSGEPRYQGRSLSKWISMYLTSEHALATDQEREKVDDAVRHMGTNAIRPLIQWYAYDWTARADRADAIYTNLPMVVRRSIARLLYEDPKKLRSSCAILALSALDSNVLSSSPDFVRFITNTNTFSDSYRVRKLLDVMHDLRAARSTTAVTTNGPRQ